MIADSVEVKVRELVIKSRQSKFAHVHILKIKVHRILFLSGVHSVLVESGAGREVETWGELLNE